MSPALLRAKLVNREEHGTPCNFTNIQDDDDDEHSQAPGRLESRQ